MLSDQTLIVATQEGIYNLPLNSSGTLGDALPVLGGAAVEAVCVDASGRGFAGAEDGRIFRSDSFESWDQIFDGFGKGQGLWSLATHPNRPNEVYAGLEPAAVYISWDGGERWEELSAFRSHPSSRKWRFYDPMKPHVRSIDFSRDGSLLSVGIEEGGVLISGDGGRTFEDRSNGVDPDIHVLQSTHADPRLIYAMTGGGLYRSRNAGVKWERMSHGLDRTYTVALAMLAADGKVLCVGGAGNSPGRWKEDGADAALYRSEDWGGSWAVAEGPFPLKGMIASILVNPGDRAHLIAGTNDGVLLQSTDFGKSWSMVRQGLPRIEEMILR